MELLVAVLVFVTIAGLSVGIWWQRTTSRALRARLQAADVSDGGTINILRAAEQAEGWATGLAKLSATRAIDTLIQQSGQPFKPRTVFAIMAGLAVVACVLGGVRTGSLIVGLLCAALAASAPVIYLVMKRGQRLRMFEKQLPDGLDMMTRAIRAGHALTVSMQLVADEMKEPLGPEFARVVDEARLGSDLNETLDRLYGRIPMREVQFFATIVKIQRTSGGNLGEMLERLAEVLRERFKLLAQANALAAQQRWSAILVGISPLGFAMIFRLMNPKYFDPLFASPYGMPFIITGAVLEVVGFFTIWQLAKLKV